MNTILQKRIEEAAFQESSMYNTIQEKNAAYSTGMKIATFVLQHQWISVEEALPPIGKVYNDEKWSDWVLIRTHKGGAYLDSYIFHKHTWTNNRDDVTHWMPIPELKGGEERQINLNIEVKQINLVAVMD